MNGKEKKLFVSSDIEGTCGIAAWTETDHGGVNAAIYMRQMSRECAAAIEGALDAGFDSALVKDAHSSARNISPELLPKEAKILRGWTNDPLVMMSGIDSTFDAAIFTGYHSPAFSNGSPLAHTMTTRIVSIKLCGEYISEFTINALTAAHFGVPVIMVTGDEYLCEEAKKLIPDITTVAVNKGIGGGSISIHPDLAVEKIREGAKAAASGDMKRCIAKIPPHLSVEVIFRNQSDAYKCGFYPGVTRTNANTIVFETDSFDSFLSFQLFCL